MSAYSEYLASTASAQAQMDFQERMSNTAHQREVADLKAAGLNPVLSAGGSGASTPTGAEGDYSAVLGMLSKSMSNTGKALNKAIDTMSTALGTTGENSVNKTLDAVEKILASDDFQRDLAYNKSQIEPDGVYMEAIDNFLDDVSNIFGKSSFKVGGKTFNIGIGAQGIIDTVRKYAHLIDDQINGTKSGKAFIKTATKYGLPLTPGDIWYDKKYNNSPYADSSKPSKYPEVKPAKTHSGFGHKTKYIPSWKDKIKSWWRSTSKNAYRAYSGR